MGRFSVLPFPTQKCDRPVQLRRFIKLFDSFANILDFIFVMVEEAKQYLYDTQISAFGIGNLVISKRKRLMADSVESSPEASLQHFGKETTRAHRGESSTLLESWHLVVVLLDVHD